MSYSHRHCYNPFAIRHLRIFLRKNWIALIIIFIVFALSVGLLNKFLPPLPPDFILGEPSFVNPGAFDFEKGRAPGLRGSQLYNMSIRPAIDPDDVLCPISFYDSNTDEYRYDIINMANQETVFLAIFSQGSSELYRPEFDEILIVNSGIADSFGERLLAKIQFTIYKSNRFPLAEPKFISRIHRFNAGTGAYLGCFEIPQKIQPIDISPNGQYMLARNLPLSIMSFGQPIIIDLNSGKIVKLPIFPDSCFFESDNTLIVFHDCFVVRYQLNEQRSEQLYLNPFHHPNTYYTMFPDFSSARKTHKVFFQIQSGGDFRLGCVFFDGQLTSHLAKEGLFAWAPRFGFQLQPERELYVNEFQAMIFSLDTERAIKSLPPQIEWFAFISEDYLWLRVSGKNRIVRIDDFLDESFKLEVDKEDK